MPDETNQNQPVQNQSTPNFTTKVIETPILDEGLRGKINPSGILGEGGGGFKGFYRANKIYFWAIFVGIILIGFLSFFAFRKPATQAPKEANVGINVEVPQTVASGGEAVYKITVQNNDSQKLTKMQLELAYPDGVVYESSSPKADNLSGSLFTIPDLISGQNAAVFLKTKVTGNVNDQKDLDIKLHYSFSNFSSDFVKDQTSSVRLAASNVVVALSGPQTTSNAQLVAYTVTYQNNSDSDIQNARVKMAYPEGFVFASATPPPDLGSDTWNIGTLAKAGQGQIQVQGTFNAANSGESKTATVEFLILSQAGDYFTQNTATFTTAISSLPLLVTQSLEARGASSGGVINPGDDLNFSVNYQNNASVVATGVNIEVDLNSKVIDPASITAEGGQVNNYTIIWNASGVPQLASLLPNQSGQLSFRLRVNNPATKDSSTNLKLVSSILIKANEYQTAFPGSQLTLKVSSPSSINGSLAYLTGSLPPQVGKSTTYQIALSLTNSSNDFASGALSAFIPLGSGGFAQGSSGNESANIQYDGSTGKLTWNFGTLPANTGRFTKPRVLQFNVILNPGSSSAGQSVTLVKNIAFTATDLFTNQPVNVSYKDISTNDLAEQNGYSNGQVQR